MGALVCGEARCSYQEDMRRLSKGYAAPRGTKIVARQGFVNTARIRNHTAAVPYAAEQMSEYQTAISDVADSALAPRYRWEKTGSGKLRGLRSQ